jgi:hypothetical protein
MPLLHKNGHFYGNRLFLLLLLEERLFSSKINFTIRKSNEVSKRIHCDNYDFVTLPLPLPFSSRRDTT